jgi:hypothetical protein
VKTINTFVHRRSNHGGHSGKVVGQKHSLGHSVRKFMLRRFAWTYEAFSPIENVIEGW